MSTSTPTRGQRSAPGFSLIELTLVIVIMGVLMGVVAVNVIGQGEKAKISATKTTMNTIRTQLDSYHLEHSAYPPQLILLQKLGYLSETKPLRDGWKRDLSYRTPGQGNRPYDLMSSGADLEDLSDDIDVWTMDQD